jgi:hypothetical protein
MTASIRSSVIRDAMIAKEATTADGVEATGVAVAAATVADVAGATVGDNGELPVGPMSRN